MLTQAILAEDIIESGKLSQDLFKKKRSVLWETLEMLAAAKFPHLQKEVEALHIANERQSKAAEEGVFAAKAMILMWTHKEPKERILGHHTMNFYETIPYDEIEIIKPVEECYRVKGMFPECYYNWHTTHGKYDLRLDAVHATSNDQRLLTPLEENLFDDCTWNHDLDACLQKWNPRRRKIPYDDGLRDPHEKFKVEKPENEDLVYEPEAKQMTIFDVF